MVVFILYFCKFILSVWTFFSVFIAVADAEPHCYTNSGIFLGCCAHRKVACPSRNFVLLRIITFRRQPKQKQPAEWVENFSFSAWKEKSETIPALSQLLSWNLIIQWGFDINSFFISVLIVWGCSFKRPWCGSGRNFELGSFRLFNVMIFFIKLSNSEFFNGTHFLNQYYKIKNWAFKVLSSKIQKFNLDPRFLNFAKFVLRKSINKIKSSM